MARRGGASRYGKSKISPNSYCPGKKALKPDDRESFMNFWANLPMLSRAFIVVFFIKFLKFLSKTAKTNGVAMAVSRISFESEVCGAFKNGGIFKIKLLMNIVTDIDLIFGQLITHDEMKLV